MTLIAVLATLVVALVFTLLVFAFWWRRRIGPQRPRAVEQNLAWLTMLSDGASEYALVLDANAQVMFASRSAERVLGVPAAELVGASSFQMDKHPDDIAGVRDAFLRAISNPGVPQTVEFRTWHRDGHWVHLVGTWRNLLHDPLVRGIVVNSRDVTEERRIAEQLAAAERKFREMIDTLPMMVYSVEPSAPYRPVFINYGHELLGYTHDEWMETGRWADAIHPDDREGVLRASAHAFETHETIELEYRAFDKSGAVRWLHDRGRFLLDNNGRPKEWQGAMIDVTERLEAARALRESEERYRRTFEDSVAANYVATPSGMVLACNAAYLKLFGFASIEDALRHNAAELYEAPEMRIKVLERLRRDSVIESLEQEFRRVDGRTLRVLENARAVFDERGELAEIHGYLFDITEPRRLAEELRQAQKMEAVGRLAGGIAHDFNNLLSVIGSYTSLLLADAPAEGATRTDLLEINRAVQRGALLTRQLLTFSRFRLPEMTHVDVDAVVRDAENMVRRLLGPECELTLQLNAREQRVLMDAGQLDQVLVNLLVNASDAMPNGGHITVTTAFVRVGVGDLVVPDLREATYIRMEVRDDGAGMDPVAARRAIEPFFTTKDMGHGTGLGLSIVFGIVSQAGGRMTLDSKQGEGTSVTIFLPTSSQTQVSVAAATAASPVPAAATRVLVVDDEEGVRVTLGRILERNGFAVTIVPGGEEAIRAWTESEGAFDLVITDLRMPTMSGKELMRHLRKIAPALPVLAMSGYPEDNVSQPQEASASIRFISKPFSIDQMLASVNALTAAR